MISYNDLRLQNNYWETLLETGGDIIAKMLSGVQLDNNDLSQETSTGHNTSHHTNFVMFQPSTASSVEGQMNRPRLEMSTSDELRNLEYTVKKKIFGPTLIPIYKQKG